MLLEPTRTRGRGRGYGQRGRTLIVAAARGQRGRAILEPTRGRRRGRRRGQRGRATRKRQVYKIADNSNKESSPSEFEVDGEDNNNNNSVELVIPSRSY